MIHKKPSEDKSTELTVGDSIIKRWVAWTCIVHGTWMLPFWNEQLSLDSKELCSNADSYGAPGGYGGASGEAAGYGQGGYDQGGSYEQGYGYGGEGGYEAGGQAGYGGGQSEYGSAGYGQVGFYSTHMNFNDSTSRCNKL